MNVTRSTFYRVKKFRGQWPHEYSKGIKDVRTNVISLSHNGGQLPSPRAHYAKKFINERNELNRWSPCYLRRRRDTDVMSQSTRMGDALSFWDARERAAALQLLITDSHETWSGYACGKTGFPT